MKKTFVTMIAACALLSACGDAETSSEAQDADAQQDLTPEGPSILSKLVGGGKPMPLDIQQAHPNGVILQINSIQAKPSETVIVATITNGDDGEQTLNRGNSKNTYIVAGDGSKLYLSPPTANPRLQIPAGQRMQAELVFLGRLTSADGATLIINDGNQTDSQYTSTPGFRVPLPLSEAAFSDDGSKKN
ncbi:hypothetical protein GRI40_09570 [Altererythrobacter aerius]|uniref:DUF4352 domain-containing protein n=1 Tax=Tsuneonella aeria TaxID=1837929 RepID=A0A6I4TE04_9SPHN|nr:hypothetical protein [Tsuneonella aeria]MXO75462.1 hypothetical protein [Tsuneonella aeria]